MNLMQDYELLIAVLVVVVTDGLTFVWLLDMRNRIARAEAESLPFLMLLMVLTAMCLAHFLGLRLVWQSIDPIRADAHTAISMILVTVLPGAPPALLFAWCVVESLADRGINQAAGLSTARRQESDFSRAKTLAARGQVDAAVGAYREYYNADRQNSKALFLAYRLLYTKQRRDEAADILREIMKTFSKDPQVWARAATELANYYQNDVRDTGRARHILREITKRAPDTEHARLAGGRLMGAWDSTSYWTPPEN